MFYFPSDIPEFQDNVVQPVCLVLAVLSGLYAWDKVVKDKVNWMDEQLRRAGMSVWGDVTGRGVVNDNQKNLMEYTNVC